MKYYLDIGSIIKKLQDVDKFKILLMNQTQRSLFELIPKPGFPSDDLLKKRTTYADFDNQKESKTENNYLVKFKKKK